VGQQAFSLSHLGAMDALGMAVRRRAILDDPDFGEDEVFCGNAECIKGTAGGRPGTPGYACEAAGAAFTKRFDPIGKVAAGGNKAGGKAKAKEDGSNDDDESEGEEVYGKSPKSPKEKQAGGKLKVSDFLKDVDLYKLLGVSEAATQDELKKAYRYLVLTAHPDKVAKDADEKTQKKAQERFVQIQEAHEMLSDPVKRMQYDSSLDFDDSLPKFRPSEGEDFFQEFGEVFKRNARFSTRRPVPELGDKDTKPEVWKKFYDFWYSFSSWRDPMVLAQQADEELYDLEDAEDRYERRAMTRENERTARKYKQAEKDRVSELVRLAEKYDPRIAAEKEAKKQLRQEEMEKREAERNAVQRKRDEVARQRREAEEAKEAEAAKERAIEKAARELVKAEVKKLRQRLRAMHTEVAQFVLLDQLNEVCLQFEQEQLKTLGDGVEKALKAKKGGAEAGAALIHQAIESIGMKPVTVVKAEDDDMKSTSDGAESEELDPEEIKRRAEAAKKAEQARKERQKKAAADKVKQEAERVIREAEKAEEKKKRDAQKKIEQEALLAKKRQEEKKEQEKLKKQQKAEAEKAEKEKLKKEQQREEAARKAQEQSEKHRAEAAARKAEMDGERVAQMYATDRLTRLELLDNASEDALMTMLKEAVEADPSVGSALLQLQVYTLEDMLDSAMAIVSVVGEIWPLGLLGPPEVPLPAAVRSRVKKARQQLRTTVTNFLDKGTFVDAPLSEWQQAIVEGTIDIPVWTPEEQEQEEAKAKAAEDASPKKGKKGKKEQPKGDEEDLDALLAEFGVDTSKAAKSGKKGKK